MEEGEGGRRMKEGERGTRDEDSGNLSHTLIHWTIGLVHWTIVFRAPFLTCHGAFLKPSSGYIVEARPK